MEIKEGKTRQPTEPTEPTDHRRLVKVLLSN